MDADDEPSQHAMRDPELGTKQARANRTYRAVLIIEAMLAAGGLVGGFCARANSIPSSGSQAPFWDSLVYLFGGIMLLAFAAIAVTNNIAARLIEPPPNRMQVLRIRLGLLLALVFIPCGLWIIWLGTGKFLSTLQR